MQMDKILNINTILAGVKLSALKIPEKKPAKKEARKLNCPLLASTRARSLSGTLTCRYVSTGIRKNEAVRPIKKQMRQLNKLMIINVVFDVSVGSRNPVMDSNINSVGIITIARCVY